MKAKRILLVEDDARDEALALRAFSQNGLAEEVAVVHDGAEALDYLFATGAHAGRDARQQPDVVLLDLHLPKVSGEDVLRRLRADGRTQRIPVVILSASDAERDITQACQLGANGYLTKGANSARFTTAVAQLGQCWLQGQEAPSKERI